MYWTANTESIMSCSSINVVNGLSKWYFLIFFFDYTRKVNSLLNVTPLHHLISLLSFQKNS